MAKKFPHVLYVRRDIPEGDAEYFLADEDLDTHAEIGKVTTVGKYVLSATLKVTAPVRSEQT